MIKDVNLETNDIRSVADKFGCLKSGVGKS